MKNSDKKKYLSTSRGRTPPTARAPRFSPTRQEQGTIESQACVRGEGRLFLQGRTLPCRCGIIKLAKASALRKISGRYRYEKHVWRKDGL